MKNFDIVIVGAGPAGIFTALEMLRKGSKRRILILEKGRSVHDRTCPKAKTGYCVNCKPYCHITTGFSGAGAFSDGKLSLSYEVGGDLPNLLGADRVQSMIDYTDGIYLEFGADTHVEGAEETDEVKDIRKRAIKAGLKLVDCPIRHIGTEMAHKLYGDIEDHLKDNGVELRFGWECKDLLLKELCGELFCHVFDAIGGGGEKHRHIFECDASEPVFLHLLQHLQKNDNNILTLLSSQNNELFLRYFRCNLEILVEKRYNEMNFVNVV